MEIDQQAATAGTKRLSLAHDDVAAEQLAHLELSERQTALSGSSSDKRQRRQQGPAASGGGDDDEPTSSLLPIQPLTEEAAQRMRRQGSPELEEEEEGTALAAMLAPQPAVDSASGSGIGKLGDALLLSQLGGKGTDTLGSSDVDMAAEPGGTAAGSSGSPGALPGSPQAAAAAAAEQPHLQGEGREQTLLDPIIRHLSQMDDAAPIQLLDVDALSKNPRLQQYQLQRAAERAAEQRGRALAAAAALRQHGQLGKRELEALAEGVLPPN